MKTKIWSKRHVLTCLMGGILRVVTATKKESLEERATLTLRDVEVFYKKKKKKKKEFDWAKGKYIHCALSMASMHALMTSIKQEVFEVRYVRNSEERCRILKACHVDLTSGHTYVSSVLSIAFGAVFWKV